MAYSLLADLVVLIHFLFVLFVLFGGLLLVHRPWMAWLHLPAAVWGALIEFAGWGCPLTVLENHWRRQGGAEIYRAGFIQHHLEPLLYPLGLTPRIQIVFGLVVVLVNGALYLRVWRGRHKEQGS